MTVSLHPLLIALLDAAVVPPPPGQTLGERRRAVLDGLEQVHAVHVEPGPDVASTTDVELPGPDGTVLRGRLYESRPDDRGPVLLQLHGGGWWQGSAFSPVIDTLARERCAALGCAVVTLEYRHAPEHPYPAALDDVTAALAWLHERFDDVHLAGQSAGANLATAAVLRGLRSESRPVRSLFLEVPALDLTAEHAVDEHTPESLLAGLRECVELYVADPAARSDELVSPVFARDLQAHPPTVVLTAEHDVLRSDGQRYTERLRSAQIPVTHVELAGHLHGSAMLTRSLPAARVWRDTAHEQLRGLIMPG